MLLKAWWSPCVRLLRCGNSRSASGFCTWRAFAVPENLMHSTSEYEVGWLGLVRARWFGLHEHNSRG